MIPLPWTFGAAGLRRRGTRGFNSADAKWIRELVAKAPSQFTQISRNPARNVTIGGNHQVFAPIYGAPFVRDLEKGADTRPLTIMKNC